MRQTEELILQGLKLCWPEKYGSDFKEGHDLARREAYGQFIRRLFQTLKIGPLQLNLPKLDQLDADQLEWLYCWILEQLSAQLRINAWLQRQNAR